MKLYSWKPGLFRPGFLLTKQEENRKIEKIFSGGFPMNLTVNREQALALLQ